MPKTQGSQLLFKIIVIGQSSTGKSCLMHRYIKDEFKSKHLATVGVEFASKSIQMDEAYAVKLQVWDTAGQENFRSIVRNFYRNCSAIFLVYNVTKRKTFGALNGWLKQARENSPKNVMVVLVGTHVDLVEQDQKNRQVTREEAEKWMAEQDISLFFETSSKSNVNVVEAFQETANQLFLNYIKSRQSSISMLEALMPLPQQAKLSAKDNKVKKTESCC